MAIARIDEFIEQLKHLTKVSEIKVICNQELDYLRNELKIETTYSDNCTEDLFIKAIMGHTEETTQSAQSYLDYELNNTEIEKLLNAYAF